MHKKNTTLVLCALLLAYCFSAAAQQPAKIPRIGYLSATGDSSNPGPIVDGFRQGLQNLGYIEGKNIVVEYRYYEGKLDRVSGLVAELVQLRVNVLIVGALPAIRAAKQATKTIPIVVVTSQDPVAAGLIDSLAHPGGNITGVTTLQRELSGKRLELIKEALPGISRVGVLWYATGESSTIGFKEYEAAARTLKIPLQSLEVRDPNPDFDRAFQAAAKGRVNALVPIITPTVRRYQKQIVDLAIKNRLPSMWERSDYVEAGGLMSYSADDAQNYRRVAYYVDRILKGAKPAELPVEQPMMFEFVINLKTAKQIDVTITPEVMARASRLIK